MEDGGEVEREESLSLVFLVNPVVLVEKKQSSESTASRPISRSSGRARARSQGLHARRGKQMGPHLGSI